MARTLHKLSAKRVETLKKPGRHSDGGGLYLAIADDGRRRWVFMWSRHGKQREIGLGSSRDVSLAKARTLAHASREALAAGEDPRSVRRQVEGQTFGEAARQLIQSMEPGWRNPKHRAQWRMTLLGEKAKHDYCKSLRSLDVAAVTTDDVLDVVRPFWEVKPETASRIRGRIERVLDFAKVQGWRSGDNPARWEGHLEHTLSERQKLTRGHHKAMAVAEVPDFVAALRDQHGIAPEALEFTILTAARTGEVIGARWPEFDLERAVWVVPPERMKGRREHRVPLCDRAMALVRRQEGNGELVWPLSNAAMSAVLERMERPETVHGFRSSFRDWAGDCSDHPRETIEAALAHVIGDKAEQSYRRSDALEKRRRLMEEWASYCASMA